jgi:ERCC4-related helicase
MADRTAARRVKRYRARQKLEREIARVEVQVPAAAAEDIKLSGRRIGDAHRRAREAERKIAFVLATINAPRRHRIDAKTFVHCLLTSLPEARLRPHIEAFFDEVSAEAIHGNKSQNQRERVLADFRAGRIRTLIATDIAARGIDVEGISHVINFDMPHEPESYVHRIGRTTRAGAEGIAISFCDGEERAFLRSIEKLIGMAGMRSVAQPLTTVSPTRIIHSSPTGCLIRS